MNENGIWDSQGKGLKNWGRRAGSCVKGNKSLWLATEISIKITTAQKS